MQYKLSVSGCAFELYPADIFFALLPYGKEEDDVLEVPKLQPFNQGWGSSFSPVWIQEKEMFPMPGALDMVYLSIIERMFYSIEEHIPAGELEKAYQRLLAPEQTDTEVCVTVGMAPYGNVAIWLRNESKSVIVGTFQGSAVDVDMSVYIPMNPNITLDEICDFYINHNDNVRNNLTENGLPSRNIMNLYMKQFTYRYLPRFEKWNSDEEKWGEYEEEKNFFEFDYIEEMLYDGTYDKLHDGGLMKYHQAGKPRKLRVQWHIGKTEYSAYLWFDDERIRDVFDMFYGAHPETKTDFLIRIDAEKKKYELALYRYGLKEPQVISEDVYQLLVFKNKFEDHRSENYNQERGAWIW